MSDPEHQYVEGLFPTVYDALRALARRRMAAERAEHTLQPTALVHEAYLRLSSGDTPRWNNPRQFYGAAAEAMRRILVDHARARGTAKRGGGRVRVDGADAEVVFSTDHGLSDPELIELSAALEELESEAPRHALVVKLRFFVGMTADEIAEAIGVSPSTVNRDWTVARAWLRSHMT